MEDRELNKAYLDTDGQNRVPRRLWICVLLKEDNTR